MVDRWIDRWIGENIGRWIDRWMDIWSVSVSWWQKKKRGNDEQTGSWRGLVTHAHCALDLGVGAGGHYKNFITSTRALICQGLIGSRCVIYFYRLVVWVVATGTEAILPPLPSLTSTSSSSDIKQQPIFLMLKSATVVFIIIFCSTSQNNSKVVKTM